jgi:hypothetical protein
MDDAVTWSSFDDDVGTILEMTLQGRAEMKLELLSTLVYNIGRERFGVEKWEHGKNQQEESQNIGTKLGISTGY